MYVDISELKGKTLTKIEQIYEAELNKEDILPLLTVSDIIEILEKKTEHYLKIETCLLKGEHYKNIGEGWSVELRGKYGGKAFNYTELKDCLFEALKEVLN